MTTTVNTYATFIAVARTQPTEQLVDIIRALTAQPATSRGARMCRAASITALRERHSSVEDAFTACVRAEAEPEVVWAAVIAAAPTVSS
ncbi:hypothetical protein [Nocardia transvalensis]|uniref:hypothetical protein n=1 Tax=Nocardia transvalensis TaxID=37333 RepID=UPI0018943A96|nr:hypothetical protein [Nocardia transvalensis]MBF6332458.1 hypothetical protein [Nocardia transvalensis]